MRAKKMVKMLFAVIFGVFATVLSVSVEQQKGGKFQIICLFQCYCDDSVLILIRNVFRFT